MHAAGVVTGHASTPPGTMPHPEPEEATVCFELDSSPPIDPVSGASIASERVILRAGDGNEFMAYLASAGVPGAAGIVILPDVRGLFRFYEELADRFAERGYDAVAIDYFGRTADTTDRGENFDFWPHVEQTTAEGVRADTAAAVALLRSADGDARRPVFTIGFCFGGSNSWLQAAAGHGLAGAIGFYGRPVTARPGSPAPADRSADCECPILALFGGADPGIPPEDVAAFAQALTDAGVPHEIHTYDGAPHSFFDRHYGAFAAESADAWERVLGFIEANA